MTFDDLTCVYFDKNTDTYYSRECQGNQICNLWNNQNVSCHVDSFYFGQSEVGEKCTSSFDCDPTWSTGCVNGTCQGVLTGQDCNADLNCLPGNYCLNSKCTPQIEIGSTGCVSDSNCVNTGACNFTSHTDLEENTCYKAFSFEPHQLVGGCEGGQSLLCKYLSCAKNADGNYYCTNLLTSSSALTSPCNPKSVCPSKPDSFFETPVFNETCSCGYNSEGKAYCNLFYGDGPGQKLLSYWGSWYSSAAILNCNTDDRNSFNCIKDYWDEKSFTALYYWYTYFNNYNLIIGAEECVVNTVAYQYAYALQLNGNGGGDSDDNSGIAMGISLLIGFAFS